MVDNFTEVERRVYDQEQTFHLTQVKFKKYCAAIKKYGYNQSHLEDRHMIAIGELISLNLSGNQERFIYKDGDFCFSYEKFGPLKLLLIGFLYCQYSDAETHASDMWLLINPKLFDKVKKEKVEEIVKSLLYISCAQRLSKIKFNIYQSFCRHKPKER